MRKSLELSVIITAFSAITKDAETLPNTEKVAYILPVNG